jgi:molybdate transport system permease protein
MGRPRPGSLFTAALVAGLGLSLTVVVALIAAQVGFAGVAAPMRALRTIDVQQAILLSVQCAALSALLGMVVAVPTAYFMARYRFRGHALLNALLDVPLVMSPIAIGITLLVFFKTSPGGWIEEHLMRFVFEVPGIILAQFIVASALQIRMLKATFEEINPRMELVARYLGCGPWSTMMRVTLPLARTGLVAAFVLGFGRAIGEYGATVTIAGSVRGKTETMPIGIVTLWSAVRIEEALALVMILTGTALVLLILVRVVGGAKA